MAPANAGSGSDSDVLAEDEGIGPKHGKQSFPGLFVRVVYGLTLNQVPLLQSWTSLNSTASLQPSRSSLFLLCSPSPLPHGP